MGVKILLTEQQYYRLSIKKNNFRNIKLLKEQPKELPTNWTQPAYFSNETKKEFASLASEKERDLEKLKESGAKQSDIKFLELQIALLKRNTYETLSNEWNIYQERYTILQSEYEKALSNEKETLKQLENQRKEAENQRKEAELQKIRDEIKQREIEREKQLESERQRIELERQRKEKLNQPLKKFIGKSVNFYNDINQQVLYGKDVIENIEYDDASKIGGRSGIFIYTKDGLEYEIICLSNPDRLADYIVLHRQYTKDYKYNKNFVNAVKQTSQNFCKKPKADFGIKSQTKQQKKK